MSLPRYQFHLLTTLVVLAMIWLLLLTGFREYWGFWQSPETYGFLKKEYPEWMREYVLSYYSATFCFVGFAFAGWLVIAIQELRAASSEAVFIGRLSVLLLVTALFSGVVGVRCTNNLIGWLDSGRLHGFTHLQVHE
jgi:dolichol kinase